MMLETPSCSCSRSRLSAGEWKLQRDTPDVLADSSAPPPAQREVKSIRCELAEFKTPSDPSTLPVCTSSLPQLFAALTQLASLLFVPISSPLCNPATSLPFTMSRHLMRELISLQRTPPEGVALAHETIENGAEGGEVSAWIRGEEGTAYEGGFFKIRFSLSSSYPSTPPKAWFTTRIFHPNVNPSDGEICVNTLKKDWKPDMGLAHVLVVIKCLLINPGPDSALNAEAGHLLMESFESFASRARLHTSIHARGRPAEFPAPVVGEKKGKVVEEKRAALGDSSVGNSAVEMSRKRSAEGVEGPAAAVKEEGEEKSATTVVKKVGTAGGAKKRGLKRL